MKVPFMPSIPTSVRIDGGSQPTIQWLTITPRSVPLPEGIKLPINGHAKVYRTTDSLVGYHPSSIKLHKDN